MDANQFLETGLSAEVTDTVTEKNTAAALGSGNLPVYSTPAMVALMETAAVAATQSRLPAGFSTVGTSVRIAHLAASPVGMRVRAVAELQAIDGRRLVFKVSAVDDTDTIGEGEHERFIIESAKFMAKATAKKNSLAAPV
jgi:predicted thioesterase